MAKLLKPTKTYHRLYIKADGDGSLTLVGGKKLAYFGVNAPKGYAIFSGAATLRKLAQAILDEVGELKHQKESR